MRFMPILQKSDTHGQDRAERDFAGPLPIFYMNDYSVLGLRVSDCAATFKLLAAHRYTVTDRDGCRGIVIRSAADIRQLLALLTKNGLQGEMADIADQMYQG